MRVIMVFLFYGLLLFSSCIKNDQTLFLLYDDVDGLTERSTVISKGMEIGSVEELKIYKNKVIVEITFNKDIQIPMHSVFFIRSKDLFGAKVIDVVFDTMSEKKYENGDTILSDATPDRFNLKKLDSTIYNKVKPLIDSIFKSLNVTIKSGS